MADRGARIFSCRWCDALVAICSICDRGNVYCAKACSAKGRLRSTRATNSRYQETPLGRQGHARRQREYRIRKSAQADSTQDVTYHRSTLAVIAALVVLTGTGSPSEPVDPRDVVFGVRDCCVCKAEVGFHRLTTLNGEDPG